MAAKTGSLLANQLNEFLFIPLSDGRYGGYKREILKQNLTAIEEKYVLCPSCTGIMRNASFSSGNNVCECCCPETEQITPVDSVRETVNKLPCGCPLDSKGCAWSGVIGELETHLSVCEHLMVPCPFVDYGCEVGLVRRLEMQLHLKEYSMQHLLGRIMKVEEGNRKALSEIEFLKGENQRAFEEINFLKSNKDFKKESVPMSPNIMDLNLETCYAINTTGKRGLCLIVNIYRPGGYFDISDGVGIFQNLNYEVQSYENVTSVEYLTNLKNIKKTIEELKSDSFIVIFSSYGDQKHIVFADDEKISHDEIILRLSPEYLPYLAGKPKLILFQNCGGSKSLTHNEMSDKFRLDLLSTFSKRVSEHLPKDMVPDLATTECHVSYHHKSSLFLQALYEILSDDAQNRKSFNDIQPLLIRKILKGSNAKLSSDQIPESHSTLLKDFYFKHPNM